MRTRTTLNLTKLPYFDRTAYQCDFENSNVADGNDGCLIECAIDQSVKHNWETDWSWECISVEESGGNCSGDFQRDCDADPEEFDPQCACPEERWMNADCSEARLCTDEESVTCPEGQIVYSNSLIDGTALEEGIKCVDEDEADCPETSYHIGCNGMTNISKYYYIKRLFTLS